METQGFKFQPRKQTSLIFPCEQCAKTFVIPFYPLQAASKPVELFTTRGVGHRAGIPDWQFSLSASQEAPCHATWRGSSLCDRWLGYPSEISSSHLSGKNPKSGLKPEKRLKLPKPLVLMQKSPQKNVIFATIVSMHVWMEMPITPCDMSIRTSSIHSCYASHFSHRARKQLDDSESHIRGYSNETSLSLLNADHQLVTFEPHTFLNSATSDRLRDCQETQPAKSCKSHRLSLDLH